jgi:imidazolonepropionase-like amidohydrolase
MGEWDQALIAQMMAHHMALIPTLTLFESENRKAHASPEQLERVDALTTGQLRDFAAAGGTILFGTDVGYIDIYDTTREYELMSRVLDWRQILASLTTNPATRFAHGGGRIEPGASADLTVLDKDPAADVTAFAQVRYTIRAGKILYQHADASAP